MELNKLTKIVMRPKKRLGRGLGSGKGKTSGRGTKGQKARGKIPLGFTGDLALFKKLPLKKGKGNPGSTTNKVLIDISKLDIFKDGTVIDLEKLVEMKIISEKRSRRGVKILSKGELSRVLTVKLPVSASAQKKIEKIGGKVLND